MSEKKSIVEQALLQVKNLEEAVKQNAKGILATTMKQELNELLKEEKEEDEIVPDEEEQDVPEFGDDESSITDEIPDDEGPSTEDSDEEPSLDDDEFEPEDEDFGDEDEDEVLDMTGASPDEVAKVFKAMKPEDGIIVKKDGDKLELSVEEPGEYIITLDEQVEEDEISDENIYEIEIDEEDEDVEE